MHKFISFLFAYLLLRPMGSLIVECFIPDEVGKKTEKQQELDYNEPLVYPYVDDKDILWSKVVYEYIDGFEQFNYPLFSQHRIRSSLKTANLFGGFLESICMKVIRLRFTILTLETSMLNSLTT
ncbi:MAG: hypothetical protein CM15mP83_4480 [Flavobacteriaceae bacterium]|nr:MAG: hypothetical protein CM15mP83_4480 [Flavobacteriaceae bacterium]